MRVAGPGSALSCDRCGGAPADRYRFCQRCGLFVCSSCWEPSAEACLSCTRPGLPVGRQLTSSIRSTFGGPRPPADGQPTSRVGRALTARPPVQPGSASRAAVAPPPSATTRRRGWTLLRVVAWSAMLGVALLLLPAVFGSPSPSASAPSVDATPRVTAQPTRRQPTPEPMRRYVVRRGDTLRSIAARFLGDASDWPRIYRVNRDRLRSPTELRVGMELRIPPRR